MRGGRRGGVVGGHHDREREGGRDGAVPEVLAGEGRRAPRGVGDLDGHRRAGVRGDRPGVQGGGTGGLDGPDRQALGLGGGDVREDAEGGGEGREGERLVLEGSSSASTGPWATVAVTVAVTGASAAAT